MRDKKRGLFEATEISSDFTPIPSDFNDVTPQQFVFPVVGGLVTRNLVELGEEMLVDQVEDQKK